MEKSRLLWAKLVWCIRNCHDGSSLVTNSGAYYALNPGFKELDTGSLLAETRALDYQWSKQGYLHWKLHGSFEHIKVRYIMQYWLFIGEKMKRWDSHWSKPFYSSKLECWLLISRNKDVCIGSFMVTLTI